MKCKVCGSESGKYPLCKACNLKKEQGLIIKCDKCGQWHYRDAGCVVGIDNLHNDFLYDKKSSLLTENEQQFYVAIKNVLSDEYFVFPQINLAAFIKRTDNSRFHNELFRNIDFLITDNNYIPKVAIEINDRSHLNNERRERDNKVSDILEEAGIPMLTLWTTYGVNEEYIKSGIEKSINSPVVRKHHFDYKKETEKVANTAEKQDNSKANRNNQTQKKQGCYIATCVYESYDCPQVWTLRRYRDYKLSKSVFGRLFIKTYYTFSPVLVSKFGHSKLFHKFWKTKLDSMVAKLNKKGYSNLPYDDK